MKRTPHPFIIHNPAMATTKSQDQRIEETFEAAKQICKVLGPLTARAQRRILAYLSDLVSDPDENGTLREVEVLKLVEDALRPQKETRLSPKEPG